MRGARGERGGKEREEARRERRRGERRREPACPLLDASEKHKSTSTSETQEHQHRVDKTRPMPQDRTIRGMGARCRRVQDGAVLAAARG